MILDKYTLLEVRAELSKLPIDKDRCRILLLPEQAWEEAQDQCIHAVEALLVQVLPLVPQPPTVTTVTPDPVAQEVKIKDASLSRTPETDAIDATADQNYGTDMYRDMLGHARRLEREVAYWKQEFYRVEKMVLAEQDRVEELERQLAAAYTRCADQVPSTWIDPLLSGPDAVILGGSDGKEIEALLSAVRKRILAARDALKGKS